MGWWLAVVCAAASTMSAAIEDEVEEITKVKWTFFLKDLQQRVFAIHCCRDDTILDVKTMYREKSGVPENSIHLLYGTKRLGVDELAGSYPDNSRFLVVLSSRYG